MIARGGRRPRGFGATARPMVRILRAGELSPVPDAPQTTPDQITAAVLRSFDGCTDPRLRELMRALVRHLHALVEEVQLTPAELQAAVDALTRTGQITDEHRQEWVLWSDSLGV